MPLGQCRLRRCRLVALGLITVVSVVLAGLAGCADPTVSRSWTAVASDIAASFPDVTSISTNQLAALLDDPSRELTLLDVREADEFAVSHLLGAVRVSSINEAATLIAAAPAHITIIAYCSVGYRSAAFLAALQEHSNRKLYNLEGSLFRWANENRPIYRGSQRVEEVHPFSPSWGELLASHRHAYEPTP